MPQPSERVIIIGAGPVGLCLALALAQQDIPITLIEALGDQNFLEQVPRAGTNHPATLEMYDRIGLYERLETSGIIETVFHYWDRADNELIAAFDHIHLKNDKPFPRPAMRAHQDRRRGARDGEGPSRHRPAAVLDLHGFAQTGPASRRSPP
jgi:2-polyprenyl-6-methoxyphenol hydroxylase-like FAD-dependent oxidoreductase